MWLNVMGRLIGISLLLLLLLGGCLTTPVAPTLSDDTGLFRFPLAAPQTPPTHPSFFVDIPSDTDEIPVEPIESEIADEIYEEEFTFEAEETQIITVAEQEQLLSQNLWVQNVALINMRDTGRRLPQSSITAEERQRRDQLARLNMTPQELAKRQNQRYDYVNDSASDWRWMHRGVDRLAATPSEQREDVAVFLGNAKYRNDPKYRTLRANAAILLGRDGNPKVTKFLLQLAQDEKTDHTIRCAAIEVLGNTPAVTAEQLIPMLGNVQERKIEVTDRKTGELREQQFMGYTEVWSELLIAIAEKIAPWEHACFLEPFYASNFSIRHENAKIWRRKSLETAPALSLEKLPEKFLDIARRETNPLVRVELIRTLGAWRVPDLFPILENDLNHRTADVRNAAMHALGDARSREAVPSIKLQLQDSNGVNRAAAVSALLKLGAVDEVLKLVNDQDYRVRVEVAGVFAERRNPTTAEFAKNYLSDRAEVQLATIEAIGGWSIDESGPLLLISTKSHFTTVRRRATEILAQRGIEYSGFDPEDRPANQEAQHEELVHVFRELVGVDPNLNETANSNRISRYSGSGTAEGIQKVSAIAPEDFALSEVRRCLDDWKDQTLPQNERQLIQRRLTAHGQRLMPLIDHLMTVENRTIPESLDKVFAEVEPMFGEIEKLRMNDTAAKQSAARELARLGAVNSPPNIAAKRMIDLTARESDPRVLTSLLEALKNADPELVCELARPLMRSESPSVRRLACEMLAQFGTSKDVHLLREALRDPSREVVRGALRGIDTLLMGEEPDTSVVEALKAMLLQSDPILQADTAATLHRLERSEGTEALRRLAASHDNRIKLYVAQTISGLEDSVFVPLLLRFLDDTNGSIRTEALKGLPGAAGQDIGRAGLNPYSDVSQTQQQIERWKAWGRERR